MFSSDYGTTLKLMALEEYSYIQSDTLQLRANVEMKSGKTFTLASDPTANLQAATKQYVDNSIAAISVPQRYNASTNPTGYLTMSDLPLYDGSTSNPT
jgi:hypothetical protein